MPRSGFHAWHDRQPSARTLENARRTALIRSFFVQSDRTYGSPRIWRDMRDAGVMMGESQVARLMRAASLAARRRRRRRPIDEGVRPEHLIAANVLQLVMDALLMAVWRRGQPREVLHHSDQGSQYTAEDFQRLLAHHGISCSMSRKGDCWDNAAMESFFSTLKQERIYCKPRYRSRDEARADIFDYIERFYNARRRHSTLGQISPVQYEQQFSTQCT